MIKIIPLLYNSYNYGGTLQYYALEKFIEEQGKSCVVLDTDEVVTPIFSKEHHRNITINNFFSKAIAKLRRIYISKKTRYLKYSFKNRNNNFNEFRKAYVNSEHIDDLSKNDIAQDCELFIAGSDQIWNPLWTKNVHFFDFDTKNVKTMVYGASIGRTSLRNDELATYAQLLEKINYISTRENEAKHIIEGVLHDEVQVVVDPVFLISKNNWEKIIPQKRIVEEKYIFCYFLGGYKRETIIAKKIARKLGWKLVTIPYVTQQFSRYDEKYADINCDDAGPLEFLGLIKNAELIITDSFHATAFSLLFHKEFYVLDRDPKDSAMLDRLVTLLGGVSLAHRLIDSAEGIEDSNIDWVDIDDKLNAMTNESRDFINRGWN